MGKWHWWLWATRWKASQAEEQREASNIYPSEGIYISFQCTNRIFVCHSRVSSLNITVVGLAVQSLSNTLMWFMFSSANTGCIDSVRELSGRGASIRNEFELVERIYEELRGLVRSARDGTKKATLVAYINPSQVFLLLSIFCKLYWPSYILPVSLCGWAACASIYSLRYVNVISVSFICFPLLLKPRHLFWNERSNIYYCKKAHENIVANVISVWFICFPLLLLVELCRSLCSVRLMKEGISPTSLLA